MAASGMAEPLKLTGAYYAGARLKPHVAQVIDGRFTMAPEDAGAIAQCVANCDGDYLEIGSLQGGSATIAGLFCRGKVYCVDIWGWGEGQTREGPEPSPQVVIENAWKFGVDNVVPLTRAEGDKELPPEISDHIFDVAFIDGDHSYEWTLADWLAVKDNVTDYVLFHDIHRRDDAHMSVKVFEEAAQSDEWEIVYRRRKMGVLERVSWA